MLHVSRFFIAGGIFMTLTVMNALAKFFSHAYLDFMLNPLIAMLLYACALNIAFFPYIGKTIRGLVLEFIVLAVAAMITWAFLIV